MSDFMSAFIVKWKVFETDSMGGWFGSDGVWEYSVNQ